ncbi:MAG: FG-GAP repeat domain-containing protein, partial [Luminiphilus sp.]
MRISAVRNMLALCLLGYIAADATADESAVSVEWTKELFEVRSAPAETPFTQHEGYQFGLTRSNTFTARDFFPPFFNGGGLASGDINRDGWPDIVSATGPLITVYMNIEGKRFEPVPIELDNMEASAVFVVALVDLNNDGWLDLFASTYLNGNVYLLNQQGRLSTADVKRGPRGISVLSASATFGDIDRDGDLDAA